MSHYHEPLQGFRQRNSPPQSSLSACQNALTPEAAFLVFKPSVSATSPAARSRERQTFRSPIFCSTTPRVSEALQENCHETPSKRIFPQSQMDFLLWPGTHSPAVAYTAWS